MYIPVLEMKPFDFVYIWSVAQFYITMPALNLLVHFNDLGFRSLVRPPGTARCSQPCFKFRSWLYSVSND